MTDLAKRRQALIDDATAGNLAQVKERCLDAELLRHAGEDALFAACEKGHLDIVRHLHGCGVRLDGFFMDAYNSGTSISNYPLYCAVNAKNWRVVEWLLENGAPMDHMFWALKDLAQADENALFEKVLYHGDYIGGWLKGDSRSPLPAALNILLLRDNRVGARICLDAGMPVEDLFLRALMHGRIGVLRDLLELGVDVGMEPIDARLDEMSDSPAEENVQLLLRRWFKDATLSDDDAAAYRTAIVHNPAAPSQDAGVPAAVKLARGRYFSQDIAPLLSKHGAALLLVADDTGCTVADIAARRGELQAAFSGAVWEGQAAAAMACIEALPARVRRQVDAGDVVTAIRQKNLQDTAGVRRLKL